jgi:hypothetical protein
VWLDAAPAMMCGRETRRSTSQVAWEKRHAAWPGVLQPAGGSRPRTAPAAPARLKAWDDQSTIRAIHGATWLGSFAIALPQTPAELGRACRAPSPGFRTVTAFLQTGTPGRRGAEAPFAADDILLTPVELQLRGTFAGTLEDARTSAVFQMEENFTTGLSRWAGGAEDWRLDAAGVRPNSLALFGPSLGARDYALEFLAKVEQSAITWVVRADNLDNYYALTLTVAAGGHAALSRHAVVCGVEGEPAQKSLAIKLRSKAAFRVQTRVIGTEFTTELEGHVVDRWSDDRLATGGIGFAAARDGRTRLYWVKLSSPASNDNISPDVSGPGRE